LFRGAISQSGGSFGPSRKQTTQEETLQHAEVSGDEYVQKANVSSIAELRKLTKSCFRKCSGYFLCNCFRFLIVDPDE
jgi:para-nitrobenzyl esterase